MIRLLTWIPIFTMLHCNEVNVQPIEIPVSTSNKIRLFLAREESLRQENESALLRISELVEQITEDPSLLTASTTSIESIENELNLQPPSAQKLATINASELPIFIPKTRFLDIPYKETDEDANYTSLDIYAPKDLTNPLPVMVWLHGGGLMGGDKAHQGLTIIKPDFFLHEGYVYVTINYRLSFPEDGLERNLHPIHIKDAAAAIDWISDHIIEYGGDPNSIHLLGHSAGGHLSALMVTNQKYLNDLGKDVAIIKSAGILDIASFDIPDMVRRAGSIQNLPSIYENAYGNDLEVWADGSPMLHLDFNKNIPPLALIYVEGREDHQLQNQKFANELAYYGYTSILHGAKNKTHLTLNKELGMLHDKPTELLLDFFNQYR